VAAKEGGLETRRSVMHFDKDHIHQIAQEGIKLSEEERGHLKNCGLCAELFRMFVLQDIYIQRAKDHRIVTPLLS
jgi:hypothetical protein